MCFGQFWGLHCFQCWSSDLDPTWEGECYPELQPSPLYLVCWECHMSTHIVLHTYIKSVNHKEKEYIFVFLRLP